MDSKANFKSRYDNISPTAKLVAFWRSTSDIPYSQKISDAVNAKKASEEMIGKDIS